MAFSSHLFISLPVNHKPSWQSAETLNIFNCNPMVTTNSKQVLIWQVCVLKIENRVSVLAAVQAKKANAS